MNDLFCKRKENYQINLILLKQLSTTIIKPNKSWLRQYFFYNCIILEDILCTCFIAKCMVLCWLSTVTLASWSAWPQIPLSRLVVITTPVTRFEGARYVKCFWNLQMVQPDRKLSTQSVFINNHKKLLG